MGLKNGKKEIERKYLLSELPAGVATGVRVLQGYLSTGRSEVRVRKRADEYAITRKSDGKFVRDEWSLEISKDIFDILWPLTDGARIKKIRYELIGPDGLVWVIDDFRGPLKVLFTAEVELPDKKTKPKIPDAIAAVLRADVTNRQDFKNKNLAVNGLPYGFPFKFF